MFTHKDYKKLEGIADNANNYIHPITHPASIITEVTNKRFMTDAEREKLTNIENSLHTLKSIDVIDFYDNNTAYQPGKYIVNNQNTIPQTNRPYTSAIIVIMEIEKLQFMGNKHLLQTITAYKNTGVIECYTRLYKVGGEGVLFIHK